MRNFVFDVNPKCTEEKVCLKDESGKATLYSLKRVNGNGCILTVILDGLERDQVVFTMQDLRALYCLLTVKDNG